MEKNKEELQQMYYEIQLLDEQLKEMQRNLSALDEQIAELNNNIQALDDFKNMGTGKSTYVVLAPGIFAKAEIKDNKELLVNVGGSITVKKSVEDTKELIKKRFDLMKEYREKLLKQIEEASSRATTIEQEITKKIEKSE